MSEMGQEDLGRESHSKLLDSMARLSMSHSMPSSDGLLCLLQMVMGQK